MDEVDHAGTTIFYFTKHIVHYTKEPSQIMCSSHFKFGFDVT